MNPDLDKEKIEAHKRMADTLVRLGLASRVVFNATAKAGSIFWTDQGLIFRDQLFNAYDQLAKGKGKEGMGELLGLLTFIITQR